MADATGDFTVVELISVLKSITGPITIGTFIKALSTYMLDNPSRIGAAFSVLESEIGTLIHLFTSHATATTATGTTATTIDPVVQTGK